MDVRRVVGGVGRSLIAAGVLILLFVAYELWGTGLAEARSQRKLAEQFNESVGGTGASTPPVTVAGATPATWVGRGPDTSPATAPEGQAIAIIKIPKLDVEKAVVEGVSLEQLKKGPGHYPSTPLPGQPGNAAIAGHRTTYGAPFFRLNEVDQGDPILVTTRQGRFRYEVTAKRVVNPEETSVLDRTTDNRLTLTTCDPRFSATRRLVVVAALRSEAADAPPAETAPPTAEAPPEEAEPREEPGPGPGRSPSLEEAESAGLSGANAANGPAVGWGLAAAAVWLLTWLLARKWRRWPAYLLGAPVFLVVLFVFFENFSRLLPSNY